MRWLRLCAVAGLFGWAYGAGTSTAVLLLLVYLLMRLELEALLRERLTDLVAKAVVDIDGGLKQLLDSMNAKAAEDGSWLWSLPNKFVVKDRPGTDWFTRES